MAAASIPCKTRLSIGLALLILVSPASAVAQPGERMPTREDIEIAINLDRIRDDCAGPGPDDGCPMIAIDHLEVRSERCAPAKDTDPNMLKRVGAVSAALCRFESSYVPNHMRRGGRNWRADVETLFLYPEGGGWRSGNDERASRIRYVSPSTP
jgi:hypothetical protein